MSTSSAAITAAIGPAVKAAITFELQAKSFNFTNQGRDEIPWLTRFIEAVAAGVATGVGNALYPELCKLQDNAGDPPASAHF